MLAKNLKYLRNSKKYSQQYLAQQLEMARSTLGDYERGHTEPNIQMLIKLAAFFNVTIDDLLTLDLGDKAMEITRNTSMRVLAVTVDAEKKNNIELVDVKAEAGYIESFQDPQYIRDLPKIHFPNLPIGVYRGFEIQGESMFPMNPGSIVISQYVERLEYIKNNKTYIIISKDRGIVYKRVVHLPQQDALLLISDNTVYAPYQIGYDEIAEVWEYYAHISFSDAKDDNKNRTEEQLLDIQTRVRAIQEQICNDDNQKLY